MTNLKILGAVVIAASALCSRSPALAQWHNATSDPAASEDEFGNTIGSPSYSPRATRYHHRRTAYRQPAYVAAGVTGAALGTAAAVAATPFNVATAPYRGWRNAYGAYSMYGQPAMYGGGIYGENGWYGDWNTFAARNGIVCRPGTWVKLDDGRQYRCQ
ncbi:hypothetical protein AC629_34300 [Bradyrhizobium sp. NAS80.1]|uniref:hypothetical protein n=1 Tax=Bradyrhizobium sp. NAS80.1 TaxID=1680159 RepID=UPI00095C3BDD|nr:hypothetical protein [Bradyrhizobium sp. NAS80.1]OKO75112.1 hypothetical protein AC629_34300 [Bradyrhizobium sp. NAS80.1]